MESSAPATRRFDAEAHGLLRGPSRNVNISRDNGDSHFHRKNARCKRTHTRFFAFLLRCTVSRRLYISYLTSARKRELLTTPMQNENTFGRSHFLLT